MPNPFFEQCYALLQQVPAGKVTTYKALAEALHSRAYQAIGQAMKHNPNLITTPCHRVVKANGQLGNYVLGQYKKQALLEAEGIEIANGQIVNFEQVLFLPKSTMDAL